MRRITSHLRSSVVDACSLVIITVERAHERSAALIENPDINYIDEFASSSKRRSDQIMLLASIIEWLPAICLWNCYLVQLTVLKL